VVGELSAELYGGSRTNTDPNLPAFKTDTVNFAKLMAGVAAVLTGNDVNVAAGAAGNAAENNMLLHLDEQNLLKNRALQIAQDKATASGLQLTDEQLQTSAQYWYGQLSAEATAKVDTVSGKDRNTYLNAVSSTDQPQLQGSFDANSYLNDAAYARTVVDSMSGQTMYDSKGNPIVADGGVLKTFQATASQQQDYLLFGTTNTTTIATQFGQNADSSVIQGALDSAYANINQRPATTATNNARLDYLSTVNGAATPDNIVEENILFGMAAKGVGLAVDAVGTAATVASRTATVVENVGANSAADSAWSASVNSTDLAALRSNLGIGPDLQTLAIARSNVPGLEGVTFNGGSPAIYDAAGLPRPEPGPISSPNPLPLFQNHAEQDIANQFVNAVNNAGLTQAELAGRNLNIMISNPTGVCTICAQGLSNPNVAPGVLMQLSNTYPGLNINVLVDTVPSIIPKTGSQITILGGARVNP
jgi:hypothetical protein